MVKFKLMTKNQHKKLLVVSGAIALGFVITVVFFEGGINNLSKPDLFSFAGLIIISLSIIIQGALMKV